MLVLVFFACGFGSFAHMYVCMKKCDEASLPLIGSERQDLTVDADYPTYCPVDRAYETQLWLAHYADTAHLHTVAPEAL